MRRLYLLEQFTDAAQDRGEVKTRSDNQHVPEGNKLSAEDIGLSRKDIFEARQIRDAEAEEPGITQRAINAMIERPALARHDY